MSSYSHNQWGDLQSWKGHSTTAHADGTHPSLAQQAVCLNTGIEITTLIKLGYWCLLDIWINPLTNLKTSNVVFVCSDSGGRLSVSRYLIKCVWDREHDSTTLILSCCYNIQTHCVLFGHYHFASCHLLLQLMNTEYKLIIQDLNISENLDYGVNKLWRNENLEILFRWNARRMQKWKATENWKRTRKKMWTFPQYHGPCRLSTFSRSPSEHR